MKFLYLATALGMAGIASDALAGAPPSPAAQATARPVDARTMDAARRLAALVNPEQAHVDTAVRQIDTSVIPALASDEDIKALEEEHPGLLKRIGTDLRPVFERYTRRILPTYIERYAAVYAAHFSADELEDLYGVYASPAGQRLVAAMMGNMTMDSLAREAVSNPDGDASLGALNDDHNRSVKATVNQLSDEDKKAFASLLVKPYFPRMIQVGPELRKVEQDMINEPDAELDAEIEAAMIKAMTEHMGSGAKAQ